MMEQQEIANLFSALRDGEIIDLVRTAEGDVQFRVQLPKLAAQRGEGFGQFICVLSEVKELSLQPFRNDSTELKDFKQINKLQLRIERGEAVGETQVKVWCAHRAGGDARLYIRAARFMVMDEAFDTLTPAELAILRGRAAGK
jgi:hypothetical protein